MGTTLIALLRAGDKIVLAHIGDSRAFMVRDGVVTQITKDHSFVQNLVDEGRITAEEAQSHPQRSLVTRVLTGAHDDEPDLVVRQGRIGDRYVIASDGLTDYVARDTISEVLTDTGDPGETADRLVALALRAGAPDNVTVVVGDLVDIGNAPPTQPQVVGAAAVRETGTRPMPTTPAAKAAALTAAGHRGGGEPDDGVTLAEEGPRSRRGTALRVAAIALVLLVVAAGSSYAGYAWSQRQYYLAEQDGVVAVFRGVEQNLGPISLSRPEFATTIAIDDLPTSYQDSLKQGIEVDDRAAADVRVAELQLQATACRWAQLNGEACRTVPATWTAPTPHTRAPRHRPPRRRPPRRPPRPPSLARGHPEHRAHRPAHGAPQRRRDRRAGDLMSIVSSHCPRAVAATSSWSWSSAPWRSCCWPTSTSSSPPAAPSRPARSPSSAATSRWPSASTSCCAGGPPTPTR